MNKADGIRQKVKDTDTIKIVDEIVEKSQQIIIKRISAETGISKKELNTFFAENTEPLLFHRNIGRMISELKRSI